MSREINGMFNIKKKASDVYEILKKYFLNDQLKRLLIGVWMETK